MKLASLKHGRDGRLVVVSKDLTRATDAFIIVPTLQAALDDWRRCGPALADLAERGDAEVEALHTAPVEALEQDGGGLSVTFAGPTRELLDNPYPSGYTAGMYQRLKMLNGVTHGS